MDPQLERLIPPPKSSYGKTRAPRSAVRLVAEYRFRQSFRVSAKAAYEWATDYTPDDWTLGGVDGRRSVEHLTPTCLLLTDTLPSGSGAAESKIRLVQLYPASRSWVSTHVSGSHLFSQFRYEIVRTGHRSSDLLFQGREIRWNEGAPSASGVRALASSLRDEDRALWRHFASAMESDFRRG